MVHIYIKWYGKLISRNIKIQFFWAGVKWLCINYAASLYAIRYTHNLSQNSQIGHLLVHERFIFLISKLKKWNKINFYTSLILKFLMVHKNSAYKFLVPFEKMISWKNFLSYLLTTVIFDISGALSKLNFNVKMALEMSEIFCSQRL